MTEPGVPTRSCVRCTEPRPGWQASPKPGAYAPPPPQPIVLIPHSNSKNTIDQTARSSSASSQPRRPASSIPRSVFGWVPSWPPSSMIREVCGVVNVQCFLVLALMAPDSVNCFYLFIRASLSFLALPPTQSSPSHSNAANSVLPIFLFHPILFFGDGGGRACGERRGGGREVFHPCPT